MLTKDCLLRILSEKDVPFDLIEHIPAETVEAQTRALSDAIPGDIVKNLFLKDKKERLYIVSALSSTKVDLKVLGARLGLGKSGIGMAPAELVEEILKVPQGSITPFAIANPEASHVVLLMDQKILSAARIYVHPLVNTASLGLTPDSLTRGLKLFARDAPYIDLEADPKIDRENPPDLAKWVPEAVAVSGGPVSPSPTQVAATKTTAPAAPKQKPGVKKASNVTVTPGNSEASIALRHRELADVSARSEQLLQKVAQALLGCKLEDAKVADPYILSRLRDDIDMQLSSLKNASYAIGYIAGKGEVAASADRRFA